MQDPVDCDGETDERKNSSTFQDFFADYNEAPVGSTSRSSSNNNSSFGHGNVSTPWLTSARSSSPRQSTLTRPQTFLSYRKASSSRTTQASNYEHSVGSSASPVASNGVFSNPNRSIFTSGQPTSSISVNTVHASMSPPPPARESRPLAALSVSSTSAARRATSQALQAPISPSHGGTGASVEKDADDPTVSMDESGSTRKAPRTSMALSQLFTEDTGTPAVSRHGSYLRTLSGTQFTKAHPYNPTSLGPHVYGQGLIGGKFSDITVNAFGISYKLHRLLLDRTPFFSTALSGPWLEANSKEMQLDPADVDPNITQAAFELALKRIYGCEDPEEEYQEAIGLFAVACWLEMDDLLEASIENLLVQMTPAKLSTYIRFVTANYYGTAGGRILNSAKAMLCRDGWQMKLRNWDGIPGEIVREIVGGDGLFVTGEWERWILAVRILNRRLKSLARDAGLDEDRILRKTTKSVCTIAPRYGKSTRVEVDPSRPWEAFYVDPEITPLLRLLDESINYVHLSFEELQHMRNERDVFGSPILPERVISAALWMQMELRQRIVNADESDLELGFVQNLSNIDNALAVATQNLELSEQVTQSHLAVPESMQDTEGSAADNAADSLQSAKRVGKMPELQAFSGKSLIRPDLESLKEEEQRKFWIPTIDATFAVGGADGRGICSGLSQTSRGSRSSPARPEDVHWMGDMTSLSNAANDSLSNSAQMRHRISRSPATPKVSTFPGPQTAFTNFPPFRFSVEFPAAASLKENKRLYSNTLWYAGSLWNVYIQKKDSAKGLQLGVYLHREKQSENVEIMLANYAVGHSVDERIGRLEREFDRRRRSERRQTGDEDADTTANDAHADLDTMSGNLRRPARRPAKLTIQSKSTSNADQPLTSFPQPWDADLDSSEAFASEPDTDDEMTSTPASFLAAAKNKSRLPALPPYIDGRPTIQTYFKIYTPSKDGRLLTVYESKPDRFNFSQSWGWKSSSLDLEGSMNIDSSRAAKDRRLRFMFVLGTV